MPAIKKLFQVAGFFLIVLFISFVFLELAGRFFIKQPYYAFPREYFKKNELYGYELAAGFKGTYAQPEFSIAVDTNSLGMRDKEHDLTADGYRILALGDSISFGIGVELKDAYLSLLEEMLNARNKGKFLILKAGIPGYSTYNEKIFLQNKGLGYRPDVVMIQFWWDDLGVDRLTYQTEAGFLVTRKIASTVQLRAFLNSHFRSYALLRRIFTAIFHRALFKSSIGDSAVDQAAVNEKCVLTLKEFKEIGKICNQHQVKCLFVLIPSRECIYDFNPQKRAWGQLCALLKDNGIVFVDLAPAMERAIHSGEKIFYAIDPHLTKAGNKVVAQELSDYLVFP